MTPSAARGHIVLLSEIGETQWGIAQLRDDLVEVFPIVGGERMVQQLLDKAFKRFGPPPHVMQRRLWV